MFGAADPPQNETTPFYPRSPYAASKVAAHWYAVNYREAYGLFICNGILFNHESPRRGETFVTRKITRALGRIKLGLQDKLYLGNLDARRDWGYAGDYVEAMWLMLQQDSPDDYVIATGESHSVRSSWNSRRNLRSGLEETRRDRPALFPAHGSRYLLRRSVQSRRKLGWQPKVSFRELVRRMVEHDMELARQEQTLLRAGHKVPMRSITHG